MSDMEKKPIPPLLVVIPLLAAVLWFLFWRVALPLPDLERSAPLRSKFETGAPQVWVFLGDSITAGTASPVRFTDLVGEGIRRRYPGSTLKIINSGVPGDTTAGGLSRLDRDVLAHQPDAVFVGLGWNDFKNGVPAEKFAENLAALATQIQAAGVRSIYLLTTTHVDVALANWKIQKRNRIIRKTAEEMGVGLIDLDRCFAYARRQGASIDSLMSEDNLHPSQAGQELIAKSVLREFFPEAPFP